MITINNIFTFTAKRKSGRRSLIHDLPIGEEERKKNTIDFNTKYMTQEANTLREKLKSRHSRGDSTNRLFPVVTSNAENNIFSKETNETEINKLTLKTANNLTRNLKNENTNTNQFNKLNPLHSRELKNKECSVLDEDKSIKVGLDVEFNQSGSTPALSEILDSENDLDLSESEAKKLIKKNLAKQYNFKQDAEIQNQLYQLKQKNKKNLKEDKNACTKDQKINENNNSNNPNSNKKGLIEGKNIKVSLNNQNNKEKYEESPKRKKHIGELIGFDKDSQRDKLAHIKNKLKSLKIETYTNDNLDKEETVEDKELSFSSDNSLMRQVSKIYKMRQKSTESLIAMADPQENKFHKINSDGKFKTISKYPNNNISALESKIGKKAMLMSEFKNSNFFHKFKLFENNKNLKNKMNSSHHSNLRNSSLENSKFNNSKNLGLNSNIDNQNTTNNNSNYKSNQDKIFLTAKELKQKKLDELYVKNINYDKILKNNLDMMRNLFPDKKGKKDFKDFQTLRTTHNAFFKKFNKELAKKSSRNSVLVLESNNNTESLNNENFNSKKNYANINNQTEYNFNEEAVNYSTNERYGFRKNEKMDKNITASNGIFWG